MRRCDAQKADEEEDGDKNETLRRRGQLLATEVHILGFLVLERQKLISAQMIRNVSNEEKQNNFVYFWAVLKAPQISIIF